MWETLRIPDAALACCLALFVWRARLTGVAVTAASIANGGIAVVVVTTFVIAASPLPRIAYLVVVAASTFLGAFLLRSRAGGMPLGAAGIVLAYALLDRNSLFGTYDEILTTHGLPPHGAGRPNTQTWDLLLQSTSWSLVLATLPAAIVLVTGCLFDRTTDLPTRTVAASAGSVPFALTATAVTLVGYFIGSLFDAFWIGTGFVAGIFAAIGGVGVDRGRFGSCIVGCTLGALLGLASATLLFPLMQNVFELLALIAIATAAIGWFVSGSDGRWAGGWQLAFAFFGVVLNGFGPAVDVEASMGQLAGVLFGVSLTAAAFRFAGLFQGRANRAT